MDYRQKRTVATVVLAVAVGVLAWAFRELYIEAWGGHVSLFTWIVFFSSAIAGIITTIVRIYVGSMAKFDDSGQKAALEALAAIGKENMAKRQQKAGDKRSEN